MNDEQKREIDARHEQAKQHGVKFFPDIIYKDMIAAFGVFVLLLLLAVFLGVKPEPPADPNDAAYVPRPEWYFLFLFQLLKYFPGQIEWIGTAVVPGLAVLALLLLPFYDRSPFRHWRRRKLALGIMGAVMAGIIGLTIVAAVTTPPQEETAALTTLGDRLLAGQDLYSIQCVECHGDEGQGGEIAGVEGLEGFLMKPMNVGDYMYTREDDTLAAIIAYGQPDLGMPPFGKAYGGELSPGEIQAIVTFMRYTWDDRMEIPQDVASAGTVPALAPGEIPSYSVHIQPIVRRTCLSCHREGKKNNNYLMGSYREVLDTGDNAPVMVAGDANSLMLRLLRREEVTEIKDLDPMPPARPLKPEWVEMFELWVAAGMPETPVPATGAAPAATPTPPVTGTSPAASLTPAPTSGMPTP
ncbi:MAG: c-type cytochrome [Chloroflexi bacterium]|nr:c-type cytochrome [Chloroflexota bacterium]